MRTSPAGTPAAASCSSDICRWVVEAAHSWFNRFRKLTPRYEKTDESYGALCMLASSMIALNKVMTIYG